MWAGGGEGEGVEGGVALAVARGFGWMHSRRSWFGPLSLPSLSQESIK